MSDPQSVYVPKNLNPEQVAQLYASALQQCEAAVVQGHINATLQPWDRALAAAYGQAVEQLRTLEADRDRALGVDPAPATAPTPQA